MSTTVKWVLIALGALVAWTWWRSHGVTISTPASSVSIGGAATTPTTPVFTNPDQSIAPSNTTGQDIAAAGQAASDILGTVGGFFSSN